jgi:hypothetical protein
MSQTPEQQQDYEDENDQADAAARSPPVTVLPRSETGSADEREDYENHYNDPQKIHVFLLLVVTQLLQE